MISTDGKTECPEDCPMIRDTDIEMPGLGKIKMYDCLTASGPLPCDDPIVAGIKTRLQDAFKINEELLLEGKR